MSHDFIRICERSPCLASGPNPTKEIGQPIYVTPQHDVNVHILGKMHFEQGRRTEAIICFREVLRRDPHNAEAYNDLGIALVKSQKIPEGAECFQQALLINPKLASALINKGNVFRTQGELEEAIACYRQAMEVEPHNIRAHNNLVYALYSCPGQNAGSLAAELRRWNERHAEPLARFIEPHRNDKTPERRLRIGYLSPDFRLHPVGRFMLTLLKAHDHAAFEICCYSSLSRADEWTNACRKHADVWREVRGWSDEQVANTIRGDRVDIMVDLTMHMANCRLLVFARKPAPVQVTYLAYPGTTGLATMDYRLTDKYLDPPGQVPRFYSEESVYLPDSFWCYEEVSADLALSPPPASKSGFITFGCLNNFCKVTIPTMDAWSRILHAVPSSRLLLCIQHASNRERVTDFFSRRQIGEDRLILVSFMKMFEYFRTYERIDVALDPFPYGGGTTTCDALWMGLPVVCLAGQMAVGRGGVSILSNIGLPELVGQDTEQYVRIAVELAGDSERLARLRSTLRQRMKESPLMDAPRLARNIEAAFRSMWVRWCHNQRAVE